MAIDPKLVSIKTAGELPVSDPSENANFLFYEGDKLQTSPMSNIYDKVSSGLLPATTTTVPEATGFHRYLVHEAGTYTNFSGIVVTAADLDIVSGVANNRVILEVNNGVATKRIERVKGDAGPASDPAKLPLYSTIKSANIATGTQFIDDENGNIQYRVKTGQTLLTTELPANVVGIKVEKISAINAEFVITNIFNPANIVPDKVVVGGTGLLTNSTGAKVSKDDISSFIGKQITIFGKTFTTGDTIAFTVHDAANTPLLYASFKSYEVKTITVPANAKWLYVTVKRADDASDAVYSNLMINEGATQLPYRPYSKKITKIDGLKIISDNLLEVVNEDGVFNIVQDWNNKVIKIASEGIVAVKIPSQSTQAIEVGTQITLFQDGNGQLFISPENSTVTVKSPSYPDFTVSKSRYSSLKLIKTAVNEWVVTGDQEAHNMNELSVPFKTDASAIFSSRVGNLLLDTVSIQTAKILMPVAKFGGTNYLEGKELAGGQAFDFNLKFKVSSLSALRGLMGCFTGGGTQKGILIRLETTGKISVYTGNGTTIVNQIFDFALVANTDYTLNFKWSGVTGSAMTLTIGSQSFTGTTNNGWSGNSTGKLRIGNYSSVNFQGNIYSLIGLVAGKQHDLKLRGISNENDINGNIYYWINGKAADYIDTSDVSAIEQKYTLFRHVDSQDEIYVFGENLDDMVFEKFPQYEPIKVYEADGLHNMFQSKIRFTDTFFDRSNATIWNAAARLENYDAANPRDFFIRELSMKTLSSYLNNGYRGRLYPFFDKNSVNNRNFLKGLIFYSTDRKGTAQDSIIEFTGDKSRVKAGDYDADGYYKFYTDEELAGDPVAAFNYWQNLINTQTETTVGTSADELIIISQPLIVPSNKTLTVNCTLKIKNASYTNLTANVTAGDTVINVVSTDGFNLGEWIAGSDNLQELQGGVVGQTRRVATSGKIIAKTATTLTVDMPATYNLSVAAGGKIGHLQSVIVSNNTANATIQGSGIIDANKYNQYNVEPVASTPYMEEIRQGSAISGHTCDDIIIRDLTVQNATLHGVVVSTVTGSLNQRPKVTNIKSYRNHDKNFLFARTRYAEIINCKSEWSAWEDGIMFYVDNPNAMVNNFNTKHNSRHGVCFYSISHYGTLKNSTLHNARVFVSGQYINVENLDITGFHTESALKVSDQYNTGGQDCTITNVRIKDFKAPSIVQMLGAIARTTFTDVTLENTAGTAIKSQAVAGLTPQDIEFVDGGIINHTGLKTDIAAGSDITFTRFAI